MCKVCPEKFAKITKDKKKNTSEILKEKKNIPLVNVVVDGYRNRVLCASFFLFNCFVYLMVLVLICLFLKTCFFFLFSLNN